MLLGNWTEAMKAAEQVCFETKVELKDMMSYDPDFKYKLNFMILLRI